MILPQPTFFSYRPWDNNNDIQQIENDYVVKTISKHSKTKTGPSNNLGSDNTSDASDSEEEAIQPEEVKKKDVKPLASKPLEPVVVDERIKVRVKKTDGKFKKTKKTNKKNTVKPLIQRVGLYLRLLDSKTTRLI